MSLNHLCRMTKAVSLMCLEDSPVTLAPKEKRPALVLVLRALKVVLLHSLMTQKHEIYGLGKSQPVQVPSKLDQSCSCSDPEGKPIQVPEDAGLATQVKSESATPTPMDSLDVTPSQDASFVTSGGPDSASGKLTSSPITESGQEQPPTVELPPDQPQEGLIEIPVEEKRFGGDFPYEVETKGYALPEPPTDLHVTTAVTGSGTLEVITEGPEGVIGNHSFTPLLCFKLGNIYSHQVNLHGRRKH